MPQKSSSGRWLVKDWGEPDCRAHLQNPPTPSWAVDKLGAAEAPSCRASRAFCALGNNGGCAWFSSTAFALLQGGERVEAVLVFCNKSCCRQTVVRISTRLSCIPEEECGPEEGPLLSRLCREESPHSLVQRGVHLPPPISHIPRGLHAGLSGSPASGHSPTTRHSTQKGRKGHQLEPALEISLEQRPRQRRGWRKPPPRAPFLLRIRIHPTPPPPHPTSPALALVSPLRPLPGSRCPISLPSWACTGEQIRQQPPPSWPGPFTGSSLLPPSTAGPALLALHKSPGSLRQLRRQPCRREGAAWPVLLGCSRPPF